MQKEGRFRSMSERSTCLNEHFGEITQANKDFSDKLFVLLECCLFLQLIKQHSVEAANHRKIRAEKKIKKKKKKQQKQKQTRSLASFVQMSSPDSMQERLSREFCFERKQENAFCQMQILYVLSFTRDELCQHRGPLVGQRHGTQIRTSERGQLHILEISFAHYGRT